MANSKNFPDVRFEKSKSVIVKVFWQIGMVGDYKRKPKRTPVFAPCIVEARDSQESRIGDMQNVRVEFS